MSLRPSICVQCRIQLQYPRLFHSSVSHARQSRKPTRNSHYRPQVPFDPVPGSQAHIDQDRFNKNKRANDWKTTIVKRVAPRNRTQVKSAVVARVRSWEASSSVKMFLQTLGLRQNLPREKMVLFKDALLEELGGGQPRDGEMEAWDWDRIQAEMESNLEHAIDTALMRRFLQLMPVLAPNHCAHLVAVNEALLLQHPTEWHTIARQVQRKIILHVGPTNSGKTYHALRALAGARFGCYAGPLRLLATEVFSRLNKGDIAPPGADTTIKHPRLCNLVTGESVKIVDEDAGLMSATVEMVPLTKKFDVVVIDEIQMLSHPERGNAWTQALLGVNAEEIHLCGEESAVELVKELVRPTGDEVIVKRYERLTPLQLAPRSLKGDLTQVRPGDCIVAFARNQIFGFKQLVEEKTGLRCAVAYGKLPPEVRVEQAQRFNQGDAAGNDYPVLVASDAIGMGLNLKIKRVIFASVYKWDGYKNVQLRLSEIKQIAGRAGRYGMHGNDAVGTATTLLASEFPILEEALRTPVPDLTTAILAPDGRILSQIHRALPPSTGLLEIFQLLADVGTCDKPFALTDYSKLLDGAVIVDSCCPLQSIPIRSVLTQAPVPWKVPEAIPIFEEMLKIFARGEKVDAELLFEKAGLMIVLEDVAAAQEEHRAKMAEGCTGKKDEPVLSVREASTRLEALELLHRMACVYLWLSYRFPIAFHMRDRSDEIKMATELGIAFCLEMVQTARAKEMSRHLQKAVMQDERKESKSSVIMNEEDIAQEAHL